VKGRNQYRSYRLDGLLAKGTGIRKGEYDGVVVIIYNFDDDPPIEIGLWLECISSQDLSLFY